MFFFSLGHATCDTSELIMKLTEISKEKNEIYVELLLFNELLPLNGAKQHCMYQRSLKAKYVNDTLTL